MMPTSLLAPTFTQMLRGLSAWLDKALRQVGETEAGALLAARLAPDMFPLSSQIGIVCLQAQSAAFHLLGKPRPERLEQLARSGWSAGGPIRTIADAQALIGEALALLGGLEADAFDGAAEKPAPIELPGGPAFDLNGEQYARDWALPQFYFHLVTAYAILRSRNIDLGKVDYMQHMSVYLRPGSLPAA